MLILSSLILICNFFWGHNKDTLLDESLVSTFAFLLLILTALMQNVDLNIQKKEMADNTQALREQQKELKENNTQIKFFRTLETMNKIKTDLNIMDKENKIYISDYTDPGKETININLSRFEYIEKVLKSNILYYYNYNNIPNSIMKYYDDCVKRVEPSKNIEWSNKLRVVRSLIDLEKLHTNDLERGINDHINEVLKKIISENDVKNEFYILLNLHEYILQITEDTKNNENSLRSLYISTLSESEKVVYRFLGRKALIKDFFTPFSQNLVLKNE
ncbi:hypothetical protein [Staphylococcus simiae]|nr:hypothetical protein [Staphylococcus simiae]